MNAMTVTMNKSRSDSSPAQPSQLARARAEDFYPHIETSALRMLAKQVLKRAKMSLPLSNRAACVAVILGIQGSNRGKEVNRGTRQDRG